MTVLEQILIAAVFVLLCTVAGMRTHIKILGKLLDQPRAEHAGARVKKVIEDYKQNAAQLAQLADHLGDLPSPGPDEDVPHPLDQCDGCLRYDVVVTPADTRDLYLCGRCQASKVRS